MERFAVGDEAVLLAATGQEVYALNESGRAIWDLCDGRHDLHQITETLLHRFKGRASEVAIDLAAALLRFQALDLVNTHRPVASVPDEPVAVFRHRSEHERPPVHLLYGIEDSVYFHWQLAILFESLVGQLPAGWEIVVVVCNDHRPLSRELSRVLDTYGVRRLTGEAHADHQPFDFAGEPARYVPVNRIEAINAIADDVEADDVVCLMDTDTFLYGELPVGLFPKGNAMASNWILREPRFGGFSAKGDGIDLDKLLQAVGCEQPLLRGGVTVFLDGATVRDKEVVRNCFRFAQALFLLAKVKGMPGSGVWVSEMACFSMALTARGVDYELLDIPQFSVQELEARELPDGSFVHYYADANDSGGDVGPFFESEWHKQLFHDRDLLRADLESFARNAKGPVEQRFFDLAMRARRRLYGNPTETTRH